MVGRKQAGAGGVSGVPSVSSALPPAGPAVAPGAVPLVLGSGSGDLDSQSGLSNARAPASVVLQGESAEGLEDRAIGGKTRGSKRGKYGKGGPDGNRGGTPKCGSLTDAEWGATSAIVSSEVDISPSVPKIRIHQEDIPPISGEHMPFSGQYVPPSDKNTHIQIDIHTQGEKIPPYFPEPGTVVKQPSLGRELGRDTSGKIIPHVRDQELADRIIDWVAIGAGENEIAQFLNMRLGVLRKNYAYELSNGKFVNDMAVGGTILNLAKSGQSERMTLLYAKARMGWRESDKNDSNNEALLNIHIHT